MERGHLQGLHVNRDHEPESFVVGPVAPRQARAVQARKGRWIRRNVFARWNAGELSQRDNGHLPTQRFMEREYLQLWT